MTGSEIFSHLSPEEAHALFESLYLNERPTYKACVQITAQRRKLRSMFLEKKPRPERHAWMQQVLALRNNDDAATEILQNWLLGLHRPMISGFLDSCGIAHEDALLETIPAQPDAAVLDRAIDLLFSNHAALPAKVYLQLFQPVDDEAWPALDERIASDARLSPATATL